jgi:phage terminase large subunit GpA-like protein
VPADGSDVELLTAEQIVQKVNGRKAADVPTSASQLTMFVDVHDKLLYWMVCAWESNFTGYVVEYGTYPQQHRLFYSQKDAKITLPHVYKGHGKEAAILAGLNDLVSPYLEKTWLRDDGLALQIGRCFIDSGYVPEMVYTAIRKTNRLSAVYPSKGVGVGPDAKPFAQYIRKIGEQYGLHWRIASTRGTRELPTVRIDTNWWKSFVQARLATHAGDPGSITLFGESVNHELLAEHLVSEYCVRTEGRGRTVDVWKLRPNAFDNHWLDCLVGCAAAATMLGVALPGADTAGRRKPVGKRMRLSDLQRAG